MRAVDKLDGILSASDNFMRAMHDMGQAPNAEKALGRLFGPSEAASMVGRDRTTLARAEAEIGLAEPPRSPGSNRRVGYTLEQVNRFRAHFGTLPWRDAATDAPAIIACQNFKGGVGKSTTTVNFAQYLALKGYRVLVIDADSQATTTAMFGYTPDLDIKLTDTIFQYVSGGATSFAPIVRRSYFTGIDLVPACMSLAELEMMMVSAMADLPDADPAARLAFLRELESGIATVAESYDVVLIDSPPSLGMISLNVLLAANALLVPCAAKMYDFSSTVQFFRMIRDYVSRLAPDKSYRWVSVVTTLFDRRYETQKQFAEVMRSCFGDSVFQRAFFHSSEIINSAAKFTTPYEQASPNRQVLASLDSVFGEVEIAMLREWPSKQDLLSEKGIA